MKDEVQAFHGQHHGGPRLVLEIRGQKPWTTMGICTDRPWIDHGKNQNKCHLMQLIGGKTHHRVMDHDIPWYTPIPQNMAMYRYTHKYLYYIYGKTDHQALIFDQQKLQQPRGASSQNALNCSLVPLGRDLGFQNHVLFCIHVFSASRSYGQPLLPEILLSKVLAIIWSVRNFWFHPRLAKVEMDKIATAKLGISI